MRYNRRGGERYPGFKMYKMIARNKHNAVPAAQLADPAFAGYRVVAARAGAKALPRRAVIDIDAIPECAPAAAFGFSEK